MLIFAYICVARPYCTSFNQRVAAWIESGVAITMCLTSGFLIAKDKNLGIVIIALTSTIMTFAAFATVLKAVSEYCQRRRQAVVRDVFVSPGKQDPNIDTTISFRNRKSTVVKVI